MLQDEFADARRALERQVEDARAASASLAKRASATAAELDAARADADEARRQLEAEKRVRQADGDQLAMLRAEIEELRAAASAEGAEGELRGAKITGLEGELLAAKLAAAPPRGGLGGPADQLAAVKKKKKQPS